MSSSSAMYQSCVSARMACPKLKGGKSRYTLTRTASASRVLGSTCMTWWAMTITKPVTRLKMMMPIWAVALGERDGGQAVQPDHQERGEALRAVADEGRLRVSCENKHRSHSDERVLRHVPQEVRQPVDVRVSARDELQVLGLGDTLLDDQRGHRGRDVAEGHQHEDAGQKG
eukprot:scaffold13160_cov106-Isochrysis_galbana.AAC.5